MPRTSRLRRIATWLALAGSLGLGVGFIVVRATAPSDGARVEFYGDGWSAAGIRIAPIDAPAPGLGAGNTVTTVAEQPIEAWLGQALAPWSRSVDRPATVGPISYRLADGASTRTVDVRWADPALGGTLLEGWSVILFSLAVAAIAAFVFARRPDEPAATALMIAACGAAGSSVPWLLGVTVSDVVVGWPFLLHALVTGPLYMLLWPAGLHLALVFPEPASIVRHRRWAIPAMYGGSLAAYGAAMLAARLGSASNLDWVATWPTIQVAIVVPLLTAALAMFVRSYRGALDPAFRTRIRWAMLGGGASAFLGLVGFMLPELILQRPLLPASWIGLTALPLPLGLALGILRDRLFDIDVVVRRTLVYGGLSVGVVACYLVVVSGIGVALGGQSGYGASLFATGVAALVALPLRDVLQRAVSRLLYGERDEPVLAIRRLGQRLELATDPDRAFPAIVDTVADSLRLPYVALEVIDETGRPAPTAERGRPSAEVVTLDLGHGSELVGRLLLGTRAGERGFRPDELRLLEDLGRQAGAAIHALRLRDDLVRSRERLVFAREEERRRLRRDLHDGLGPSLASIGLRAEAATATMATDPAEARRLLDELGVEVQTTLADVRRLVEGLRPPALDELGLVGAIRAQAARLEGGGTRSAILITVVASPLPLPDLPAAVEVAAYRIVAEALTNAARHAEAATCRVHLESGEELTIEIVDDGRGVPRGVVHGTGLESMSARAAELGGSIRIERRRGGGTRVVARLPIVGRSPDAAVAPDGATGTVPR
ncbi:MAG TPA: GAF domain-containing sensor histidine kinase [Candidatus Limnocylindrales bacterium]|nr:GAF domain-containing sensor histidine kinase [Candidatus Limnocylindrales bacterium]